MTNQAEIKDPAETVREGKCPTCALKVTYSGVQPPLVCPHCKVRLVRTVKVPTSRGRRKTRINVHAFFLT